MADISVDELTERTTQSLKEQFLIRGKLFIASSNVTFAGTSFERKILIRNPSGSGINMIIFTLISSLELAATTSQLNELTVAAHKGPTISVVGTTVVTNNLKSDGSDTTQGLVYKNPTITANGLKLGENRVINSPFVTQSPYFLAEGDDLLIRMKVNDAANGATFSIIWAEDDV